MALNLEKQLLFVCDNLSLQTMATTDKSGSMVPITMILYENIKT